MCRLRVFESGVMVLQLQSHREDAIIAETEEAVRTHVTSVIFLVHDQVTIIFVVSVCLFVCAEFFSAVFDPIWIKLGHVTCPGLVVSPRI